MAIARFITTSISTIFIFTTGEIKISRWAIILITKALNFIKKYLIIDYEGKKCRSRRVYSEHHATFAIDNFEYAKFWLGNCGEFTLKDPFIAAVFGSLVFCFPICVFKI